MRHMIGLDVRKISWEKEIPLHTIKCYSFKEVSFWKKNPVCYFTFNVRLSPLDKINAQNEIFKREKSKQEYK